MIVLLCYRFHDGNIIESTNSNTLVLNNLVPGDSGVYACRVHNDAGRMFSDTAELTVTGEIKLK